VEEIYLHLHCDDVYSGFAAGDSGWGFGQE
jgi:hypothetical protein